MSDPTVIRFSTEAFSHRDGVEVWREILWRMYLKLDVEPAPSERFHSEATLRALPGLGMISCAGSGAIYRRPPELIDDDDLTLIFGSGNRLQARQGGREAILLPGDAVLLAGANTGTTHVLDGCRVVGLRVPLRILSPVVANWDTAICRRIPADTAALQLLRRYLGILEDVEALATPSLRHQAVTHIHDLIALAVGATRDAAEDAHGRGLSAARLRAIKQDVADRLHQCDLSVGAIAVRHRCTPRYVQRLFEGEGTTFTEYVQAQRLERARAMLTDARFARQKIATVAFDAGFGDLSYFNRSFRLRFGATPSDVRAKAMQ